MIGRYERDEAIPSIEAAKKIADAFGVSLDFLVGEGINAAFDKKTLQRLPEIQGLDPDTKGVLYNIIDTYLRDAKARRAYSETTYNNWQHLDPIGTSCLLQGRTSSIRSRRCPNPVRSGILCPGRGTCSSPGRPGLCCFRQLPSQTDTSLSNQ
jgi:transcriptional regulator with XRE-family HTH domain